MAPTMGPVKPNPNFLFHPCRSLSVRTDGESVDADAVNLVAASSRFGIVFVGFDQGVKIYSLQDIQNCDAESRLDNCPYKAVPTAGSVTLVSLSADDLTLAVVVVRDSVAVADMYDVRGFAHQVPETRPFFSVHLSTQPTVRLQDFMWNPVLCGMFAVCLTDGSVANYELCGETLKMHGSLPASTGGRTLAWSPKGKQVVVGKQDGSLVQYKPSMQEAKTLPPPTIFENPVQVMSVCWIAPTVFAAIYLPSRTVEDAQAVLVITAFSKATPVTYTAFEEVHLKTGTHPIERFWLYHQPDWGILMCASRNSNETAVLGCVSADKMKWEQWELDSDGRAEVPLNKGEDTFPLGFAVIYSSQRNIVGKLQTWPPMPILLLFSTSGALSPFHMKNLAPGVPSIVRPPELLTTEGQRKPMVNPPHVQVTAPHIRPLSGTSSTTDTAPNVQSKTLPATPASPQFSLTAQTPSGALNPVSTSTAPMHTSCAAPRPIAPNHPQTFSSSAGIGAASPAFTFGSSGGSSFNFGHTAASTAQTSATSVPFSFSLPTCSTAPTASIFGVTSASSVTNATIGQSGTTFSVDASSFKSPSPAVTFGSIPNLTTTAPPSLSGTTPTTSASRPFSFGTTAAPETSTVVSSAFTFVPKQTGTSVSPSTLLPSLPRTTTGTSGSVKQTQPLAPGLQQPKKPSVGESSGPTGVTSESAPKRPSDNAIAAATMEEVGAFEKELQAFRERASKVILLPGTQEDMNQLKENSHNMERSGEKLQKDVDGLNSKVHVLNSLVLEAFAAVEEGRTQELRNRDPRFIGLLHDRQLDPMTAQHLSEIRQLHQYLESQLRDVHTRLDLDWQEYLAMQKEKCRLALPSAEAMYEVIQRCHNTSQSLMHQLDALSCKMKELKTWERFGANTAHWDETFNGNLSNVDELSALADTLLWTSLSSKSGSKYAARNETASRRTPLSLRKQGQLAEYFGQQSVTPVRARVIANPSESRLLSKLSLLQSNESSVINGPEVPLASDQMEIEQKLKTKSAFSTNKTPLETHAQENSMTCPVASSLTSSQFASTPIKEFVPPVNVPVGSITSSVPHLKTTAAPITVPITKVIEVSLPPSQNTSALLIPPGLTITPIKTPDVQPAVVTMGLTKPVSTYTDTTSKPSTAFCFAGSATTSTSSSLPAAPVFSFGKSTAPTAFTFGTPPLTKPGFVAVKPPALGLAGAVEAKPEDAQGNVSLPPATTAYPQSIFTKAAITAAVTATTAAVTSSVISFPVVSTSTTSAPFKLSFGQSDTSRNASIFGNMAPVTTKSSPHQLTSSTSIFGNTSQSSVQGSSAASAAAFSFTAALAASRQPATTADTKQSTSPAVTVAKPMPVSLSSVTSATSAAQNSVSFKPPTSSGPGAFSSAGALFHPVPVFGSSSMIQSTTVAATTLVATQPTSKDTALTGSCKVISTTDTSAPVVSVGSIAPASASLPITSSQADAGTAVSVSPSPAPSSDAVSTVTSTTGQGTVSMPHAQNQSQSTSSSDVQLFGQTPTTVVSPFGQSTALTQASPFGHSVMPFGKPQSAPTSVPTFGQSPPVFGQATSSSSQLLIQTPSATTPSAFGQTATTAQPFWKPSSAFGQSTPTSASIFGQSVTTTATPVFSQPASSAPSVFGQSSVFGSSHQSPTTEQSPFGQMTATSTAASGSLFGQKSSFGFQPTTSPFGQSESLFGQKTSFGQSSVPSFGQQQGTCTFGEQSHEQGAQQGSSGSLFGGSGFLSGLGGKPSGEGPTKNVFGSSSTFGAGTQSTGLFGSHGASSFGSSFGSGAFSGGSFSTGGGGVAQAGFGAFQQQTPTKPAAFGGPPAFGGSPSFGGPPQFGGSPTFGTSPGVFASPFGSPPQQQSPQQQQQQQPGSSFSVFGSTEGPTFGTLAAQGQGVPQQQQQQQQSLGFGSTFGSSPIAPTFGSPGFGDHSTPRQNSAFSQWRQ